MKNIHLFNHGASASPVGAEKSPSAALTGAGAVVHAVLLRVTPQSALEAMLPEFREPRVPHVGIGRQLQVVVIEPGHVGRL